MNAAAKKNLQNAVMRFAIVELPLYAFVASIPFETATAQRVDVPSEFTIARVFGFVFALAAVLVPQVHLRAVPKSVLALWLFVTVVLLRVPTVPAALWPSAFDLLGRLTQEVLMVWLVWNVLKAFPITYKRTIFVYTLSCAVLSVLQLLSITATAFLEKGRMTILKDDPNTACGKMAIAAIVCVFAALSPRVRIPFRIIAAFALIPITLAMIGTGSRGGLLAFIIGSLVASAPLVLEGNPAMRIGKGIAILFVFGALVLTLSSNETMLDRIQQARGGDLAGRESIYPEDFRVLANHPLLGAGPIQNYSEIGLGTAGTNDTMHSTENTFLWALTAVGALGSAPFFFAVFDCFRRAWRARRGGVGWLPIAIVTGGVAMACTLEWHGQKPLWFVLAIGLASLDVTKRSMPSVLHHSANNRWFRHASSLVRSTHSV